MSSTRARFTISYVTLAMGAVIVFAVAVYSARKTVAQDQLSAQAQQFADGILADIRGAKAAGVAFTGTDTTNPGLLTLSRDLRSYLDTRPGYFILFGPNDQPL